MRKLQNTLYITTQGSYLHKERETLVVEQERKKVAQLPVHSIGHIFCFGNVLVSPFLLGFCGENNVNLAFFTENGRYLGRLQGRQSGNVLLRRVQYRVADDQSQSVLYARNMILGKVYNARWSLHRTLRDHGPRINEVDFRTACQNLSGLLPAIAGTEEDGQLRGLEGAAANIYFDRMDDMILGDKDAFFYHGRSRRPPMDRFNALLSFAYSLLASDCANALESVGLDSFVGFLHEDRPGRKSLALDLMEELRPCLADRFVLSCVNNCRLSETDFETTQSGAVLLTEAGRRKFLKAWQERKQETITHPYLQEKIPWGLVPYVQALLLARCLRGDLDGYPPFLWK